MGDVPRQEIAGVMRDVARDLEGSTDVDETIARITQLVCETVPHADYAGILIGHRDGRRETKAATHELVERLDAIQCELDEGPCIDALASLRVVESGDLCADDRWPRYAPRAKALGVVSQMGLPLFARSDKLGGLNIYSTELHSLDGEAQLIGELFATHAGIALGRVRKEQQLNDALTSRRAIGQALGITMERYQVDEERAFQFLLRVSQNGNIKLRDLARDIVSQANEQGTGRVIT